MRAAPSILILLGALLLTGGCKPDFNQPAPTAASPSGASSRPPLPKLWMAPQLSLQDQEARPFESAAMRGKVWVVDFFYTSCPGPCPAMSSRLSDLHRQLASEPGVGFLSISTDPQKDQPEVLQKYARKFGADARWLFLTGAKEHIFSVANEGFKLALTENKEGDEPVTHSTRLVLVDQEGWVRGFYEGVGEDSPAAAERLVADIRSLLKTQP